MQLNASGQSLASAGVIIGGGGEQGLLPGIPNLGLFTFPTCTRHSLLDSKLVQELGKCESLHRQVLFRLRAPITPV